VRGSREKLLAAEDAKEGRGGRRKGFIPPWASGKQIRLTYIALGVGVIILRVATGAQSRLRYSGGSGGTGC
jgi:hypothetical protein